MSHGISPSDSIGKNPSLSGGILPLGTATTSVWDTPIFGKGIQFDELVDLVADEIGNDTQCKPVAAPENRRAAVDVVPPTAPTAPAQPQDTPYTLRRRGDQPTQAVPAIAPVAPAPLAAPQKATKTTELRDQPTTEVAAVARSTKQLFTAPSSCDFWGLKLSRVTMDQTLDLIGRMILDRIPRYVITANLNYAMLVDDNPRLAQTTDGAAMVLADGQPLVWRSRLTDGEPLPQRVTGSELIYQLAERAVKSGWRIYFLGAEPGVAQKCADTLVKRYPGLQIAGVQSPPYRKLTEQEILEQRDMIRSAKPDILLVAFGQPKGELWIEENYRELGIPVSIQLGASFDFVAGRAKRAPKLWQVTGLEWAYRMMSDPKRLIPRYTANAWFLFRILLQDWKAYVDHRFGQHLSQPQTMNPSHTA